MLDGSAVDSGNWAVRTGSTSSYHFPKPKQNNSQFGLVILPVTVKDRRGNLAAGMQQCDFRVFDDNGEQLIEVFYSEGVPLSLVLLIDDDLKDDNAQQVVTGLHSILAGISSVVEAVVCTFELKFHSIGQFTEDSDRLFAYVLQAQEASKPGHLKFVPCVTALPGMS